MSSYTGAARSEMSAQAQRARRVPQAWPTLSSHSQGWEHFQ